MRYVPEIKLIRTDTTLDLSQKAEKVWLVGVSVATRFALVVTLGSGSKKIYALQSCFFAVAFLIIHGFFFFHLFSSFLFSHLFFFLIFSFFVFAVFAPSEKKYNTTPLARASDKQVRPEKRKKKMEKTEKKIAKSFFNLRIEKRGLNLMRSMQQGISTHYNTRFEI